MRNFLVVLPALFLIACAQEKLWVKPGASTQEFAQQRYACMQQSQQQVSVASVGRYGGFAQSGQNTNSPLFNACMSASGWALIDKAANDTLQAAAAPAIEEGKSICSAAEYQEFFRRIPCLAKDATSEQLADRGKLTPTEKVTFLKIRQAGKAVNEQIASAQRQHNPISGAAIAEIYENGMVASDRLAQDLAEGRITRGEYNKSRLDLHTKQLAEMQKATVR